MAEETRLDTSLLEPDEIRFAKVLLANNLLSREKFAAYLAERSRFDSDGKRYLGDILVELALVSADDLDEFFQESNERYLLFLEELVEGGYLPRNQWKEVMDDDEAETNVVNVLERRGVMTKANFSQLFSKRVNALRLGDWLLSHEKIKKEDLDRALAHQRIYRLDDWLVAHKALSREKVDAVRKRLGMA
jgi:hypothetical protein